MNCYCYSPEFKVKLLYLNLIPETREQYNHIIHLYLLLECTLVRLLVTIDKLGVGDLPLDFVSILPLGKLAKYCFIPTHFDYVVLSGNMEQDSLYQMFLMEGSFYKPYKN